MIKKAISILLSFLSLGLLWAEQFIPGLFTALISFALLYYYALQTAGINSVYFLFLTLFGLYGYSVPLSVFFEVDMGWHRVAKLRTWQEVDYSLYSYMIANQIALLAIQLVSLFFANRKYFKIKTVRPSTALVGYYQMALLAGFLSSVSEGINFIRAGGFRAMSAGKAYYQGAVSDLALNIPYEGFFFISVALFSVFLSDLGFRPKAFTYIFWYLVSISFVLFVNLGIGERGLILVAIVICWLGYTLRERITKIRISYLFIIPILYLGFSIITLLREPTITYEGYSKFFEDYGDKLVSIMNPANTEFGSPALNYRIFISKMPDDYGYKFGSTYLELPLAFTPTYLYPNKPKGIIYEFRDTYFKERSEDGSTAGTGFSSLLEAYMNFGYFGPFLVYLCGILFLLYFESRKGNGRLFDTLIYLLLFNIFLILSRTNSQYIFYNIILYTVQSALVLVLYKYTPRISFARKIAGSE